MIFPIKGFENSVYDKLFNVSMSLLYILVLKLNSYDHLIIMIIMSFQLA